MALIVPISAMPEGPASGTAGGAGVIDVEFTNSAPYGVEAEMMRHLGYTLPTPPYELGHEKFRVIAPPISVLGTNSAWGLLVWISPGDDPQIPHAWEEELAKRRFLFVCAYGAGNERHAIQRCRLALDATCNMARRFKLDPGRIYVGGFSGGGRIASILGVAYADVFAGTLAICGVDFYRSVAATDGQFYPPTYRPDPRVLARAKSLGRFVLLTGEKDANRDNTRAIAENGFRRDGFRNFKLLDVAGMKHEFPTAGVFATALDYLSQTSR